MSELKKYVLLNDNTILDISTDYVKKTSDNILDLLEEGDLLEIDNDWEMLKVLRFNKNNQPVCIVRTSSNIEEYKFDDYRKKHIKAIYKLSPNGDYKRYEVKE